MPAAVGPRLHSELGQPARQEHTYCLAEFTWSKTDKEMLKMKGEHPRAKLKTKQQEFYTFSPQGPQAQLCQAPDLAIASQQSHAPRLLVVFPTLPVFQRNA